jgi:hypothetical protein
MPVLNQAFYLPDKRKQYYSSTYNSNQTTQICLPLPKEELTDEDILLSEDQDPDTFIQNVVTKVKK